MGFLYINPKGKTWSEHSYSAGNSFDQCPYKYYLQKVLGWKEKNTKARFEFGHAFESAVQYFHEHRGERDAAIAHFVKEWTPWQKVELQYTKVEKNWETCLRIGTDWLKLYAIRQPSLPIPLGGGVVFQQRYEKEVFPGDPVYGGIIDVGKFDIIAWVDPKHPLLPKLDWKPEYGALRPLIVDIKTAGSDFPEMYGIAAYDTQLRRYSWQSGIRDAALLWFVKKGLALAKGYSVTLLEDAGYLKAGQEAVIAQVGDVGLWLVANDFLVEEMERAQGKSEKTGKTDQTKEAKARRDAWLETYGTWVREEQITKQRLQFNAGFITNESAEDAGKIAADQIVRIVNASRTGVWTNTFGVRYPKDDRADPYFRAFVLNDQMFKNQNFKKTDEDVDIFAEDNEPDA